MSEQWHLTNTDSGYIWLNASRRSDFRDSRKRREVPLGVTSIKTLLSSVRVASQIAGGTCLRVTSAMNAWLHLKCARLRVAPVGEWLCKDCRN